MKQKKPLIFRVTEKIVRLIYRPYKIIYYDDITEHGNLFIANHAQIHGPLATYLYFPFPKKTWVISNMTKLKEVPAYAREDFWRHKHWSIKWLFWIFSYMIAPISVFFMKYADTIPVYKDMRAHITFRDTIESLSNQTDVVIFPECRKEYNHILFDFQKHFVDIARLYYKKHHQVIKFYPMYICKDLKTIVIGKAISFNPDNDIEDERIRITTYLREEITKLALDLPSHKVIPYINGLKRVKSK